MAATTCFPEPTFQNHAIHESLLQYQMLFPSLLMCLGAPPSSKDSPDYSEDDEGKANTLDYLRYSALANQLAITQINQALMELTTDTGGDNCGKLKENLVSFMSLTKEGFNLLSQEVGKGIDISTKNNNAISKQDEALATMEGRLSKGFEDGLAQTDALKEFSQNVLEVLDSSASGLKESQGNLSSISGNLEKVQQMLTNLTDENSFGCQGRDTATLSPPTDPPVLPMNILVDIQEEFKKLSQALKDVMTDRMLMKKVIEQCSSASIGETNIDLSNITREFEKSLITHVGILHPPLKNISQRLNGSSIETKEELRRIQEQLEVNLKNNDVNLDTLNNFTVKLFNDLAIKVDGLYNISQKISTRPKPCPIGFFEAGEDCYYLTQWEEVDYEDASEICGNLGGHLAEPKKLYKFLSVMSSLTYNNTVIFWVGGRKRGSDFEWVNSKEKIHYGWNTGYPLGDQNCVVLKGNGLEDSRCEAQCSYICEAD